MMRSLRADDGLVKQHLAAFARQFVLPLRAARYEYLASTARGIQKWRRELDHFQNRLRMEFATVIPAELRTVQAIRKVLQSNADQAVVFSANSRLSGRIGDIGWILEDVISTDIGAIVSIVPGELALYWGEEPNVRLLLRATS